MWCGYFCLLLSTGGAENNILKNMAFMEKWERVIFSIAFLVPFVIFYIMVFDFALDRRGKWGAESEQKEEQERRRSREKVRQMRWSEIIQFPPHPYSYYSFRKRSKAQKKLEGDLLNEEARLRLNRLKTGITNRRPLKTIPIHHQLGEFYGKEYDEKQMMRNDSKRLLKAGLKGALLRSPPDRLGWLNFVIALLLLLNLILFVI